MNNNLCSNANFAIFRNVRLICIIICFGVVGLWLTLRRDGEARLGEPKTVYEEHELVEKAIPSSIKYKKFF